MPPSLKGLWNGVRGGALLALTGSPIPSLNGVFDVSDAPDPDDLAGLAVSAAGKASGPWSIQLRAEPTSEIRAVAAERGLTAETTYEVMTLTLNDVSASAPPGGYAGFPGTSPSSTCARLPKGSKQIRACLLRCPRPTCWTPKGSAPTWRSRQVRWLPPASPRPPTDTSGCSTSQRHRGSAAAASAVRRLVLSSTTATHEGHARRSSPRRRRGGLSTSRSGSVPSRTSRVSRGPDAASRSTVSDGEHP